MGHSVEAAGWAAETDKLLDRMAARFARVETRRRAGRFVRALLADLPRKNCWSIAEHAGDADPYGMQHFLSRASWDTDGVRDDLRDYVIAALGDTDAVLVVDETGISRRVRARSVYSASTPVLPGGSRMPRSRSISPTPPTADMR